MLRLRFFKQLTCSPLRERTHDHRSAALGAACGWAGGLPGLGPEALLIQIAARPGSFRAWADLIPRLESLAVDCCVDRVVELMDGFSASAWQRAAYLLDRGRMSEKAKEFMARRPSPEMPAARLGDGPTSVWSNEFGVNDRLVAPLQDRLGKS